MNHETLQALYALDVAEAGEEEAAKRWEYWAIGDKMWNTSTPVLMFIGQDHRRKPGIPWPKVMMPKPIDPGNNNYPNAEEVAECLENCEEDLLTEAAFVRWQGQEIERLSSQAKQQQWPADAPEWANAAIITWCKSSKELVIQGEQRLIERPKPVKRKIDWSKLRAELYFHIKPVGELKLPSPWIAWNCDEHTRGNPLPDGLVVEWFGLLNTMRIGQPQDWEFITRFRIIGIQEGWE